MQIRNASYNAYLQISAALLSWGLQTAWVIDPINGSDVGNGDPSSPLKTMGEFNQRLCGNVVRQPTTLQLLGDVTDEPLNLVGTRFVGSGTLTATGTVTITASGAVTVVTALLANATYQLDTTGVTWTSADVGKRLALSTGGVCWVQEVLGANQVVIGPVSSSTTTLVPTAPATFDVQSLSSALCPSMACAAINTAQNISLQNLSFPSGSLINAGSCTVGFFGCKVNGGNLVPNAQINWRGCCVQTSGIYSVGLGGAGCTFAALTCIGGSFAPNGRPVTITGSSFQACNLSVTQSAYVTNSGAMHFRNVAANCIQLQLAGRMTNQNFVISGSVGNTGFGIFVRPGCGFTYLVNGTKPTVTGTSGDTKIGTTIRTYAQIPYADLQLNAIPPTVTTLTGSPAFMTLEN